MTAEDNLNGLRPWVKYKCVHCGNEIIGFPDHKEQCQHQTSGRSPRTYFYPFDFNGIVKENIPKNLLKIVKNEKYLDTLLNESSKRIAGEDKTRKALIVLLAGGRLVKNAKPESYNILLSSYSGAGKDHQALNILLLLPKIFWEHKTRLSEKALSYWHTDEKEPNFSWNGKILYCEDVTNHFLNSDTVKVMMTGGSDIAVVVDGELKSLKVNGTPRFLVTSATAEPNKELNRRITALSLDSSQEQTEKILEFQSRTASEGMEEYDKEVVNATYLLRSLSIDIPFSKKLIDRFPHNIQARTNYHRLLDIIKAHTALNQYNRKEKSAGVKIANYEDLIVGLEIYKTLFPERNTSLTSSQRGLVDYLKAVKVQKTATELFHEVGLSHYTQINSMIEALKSLASKGFISISNITFDAKERVVYEYIPDMEDIQVIPKKEEIEGEEDKKKEEKDISNLSNLSDLSKVSNLSEEKIIIHDEDEDFT